MIVFWLNEMWLWKPSPLPMDLWMWFVWSGLSIHLGVKPGSFPEPYFLTPIFLESPILLRFPNSFLPQILSASDSTSYMRNVFSLRKWANNDCVPGPNETKKLQQVHKFIILHMPCHVRWVSNEPPSSTRSLVLEMQTILLLEHLCSIAHNWL